MEAPHQYGYRQLMKAAGPARTRSSAMFPYIVDYLSCTCLRFPWSFLTHCRKCGRVVLIRFQHIFSRKARKKDREINAGGPEEPKLYLQEAVLERKLSDYDLRTLIELPPGLDYNEWLASHTIAFFEHVNLIYGTISEFCTISGCPDMIGPGLRQYLWFDEKGKKAKVAAPQYIDYVMTFIQKTVNDESIFPTKYANEFPDSFESIVKKIQTLVFHVLAHLYHSHFREILLLKLHSHLNCVFAHFILFNERFKLIEAREVDVLQDLVTALKLLGDENKENMVTSDDSDELNPSCGEHEQDVHLNEGTLVLSQP